MYAYKHMLYGGSLIKDILLNPSKKKTKFQIKYEAEHKIVMPPDLQLLFSMYTKSRCVHLNNKYLN